MRKQKTKAQVKKKLWGNTHAISLTLIWIPPPAPPLSKLSDPPIIYIKTMSTEFLAQMRQSNKCESVRNDEILNLHLGSGVGSSVGIPCLLQDTSHIYWFHPPKQLIRKKQRTQKRESTLNKSYLLAWPTYTEPRAKRDRLATQP